MAAKKKTKTTTTPIKQNETKNKPSDEVIISAPTEPITKATNSATEMDAPQGMAGTKEPTPPTQNPQIDIFTKDFCGSLWEMLFSRLAATKGNHWKLSESEKLTIGETTSAVANRYVGSLFGDYPELAALSISVVVIAAPRILEDGKIKRTDKQLADRAISEVGTKQDPSVSSVLTIKEQPGSGSREKPSPS